MNLATPSRFLLDRTTMLPSAWAGLLWVAVLLAVVGVVLSATAAVMLPDPAVTASWRWPHGVPIFV